MQKEITEIPMPLLIEDLGMKYQTDKSKYKKRYGLFKCYCGKEFEAFLSGVKSRNTKSCGCYKKSAAWNVKHGLHGHKLYNTWNLIMQRVSNEKHPSFKQYGLVGIGVCEEWKDFSKFLEWSLLNGWKKGLTIDRINGEAGYSPDNCRWTTKAVQSRNTKKIRKNNKSGYRGVSWVVSKNKFVTSIGLNGKSKTIGTFNTAIEAAIAYDHFVIENNLEHTRNFDTMT